MNVATPLYHRRPLRGTRPYRLMSAPVTVGGRRPGRVQSMTNTDDGGRGIDRPAGCRIGAAGSEMCVSRLDRDEAAAAVPHIKRSAPADGRDGPDVGDFHYIRPQAAGRSSGLRGSARPSTASIPASGLQGKAGRQFGAIDRHGAQTGSRCASAPIGVPDQALLTRLMDENAKRPQPADMRRRHPRGDGAVGADVGCAG